VVVTGETSAGNRGNTYDVLLQGSPFCDLTFSFPDLESLPGLGQEVFAHDFAINPGGVFNVSSSLSRLGLRVGLRAQLGNDIFSRYIAGQMEEYGLSLDLTCWIDQPLPVVTAGISLPQDRLFISYAPPRDGRPAPPRITVQDLDRYRPRALFTYGEVGIEVCREARRRGILVYVDAHWNPEHLRSSFLREILHEVDIFSPNLPEALEITGTGDVNEALEMLAEWCRCVVIKRGAEGCMASRGGERYCISAIPVEAVETTGAGDNFNAGLIYGMLEGFSFETCLQCANIAGGLSTAVLGGCRSGINAGIMTDWLERLTGDTAVRRPG